MNVIFWSRETRDKRFEYKKIDELLKKADFVFPALARKEEAVNDFQGNI